MNMLQLYFLFVKIGAFTFGGGYAMIPLFQDELVFRHEFMTNEEFANMVALAQMTPGPVGLNAATYIGAQQGGFWGALAGTLGVMTPSLILVTLAAVFIAKFKDSSLMKALLGGIRPATLGLIAVAVIFFADTSVFSAPLSSLWEEGAQTFGICWQGTLIFVLTLWASVRWKVSMIPILLGAALAGWLLFLF
mgnify:CR=1 FL=1